jgi:hypothetical protein
MNELVLLYIAVIVLLVGGIRMSWMCSSLLDRVEALETRIPYHTSPPLGELKRLDDAS